MKSRHALMLAMIATAACNQQSSLPGARFANAPPVRVVDDRRDVPTAPTPTIYRAGLYHYDGTFHHRVTGALTLERSQRALGVNALDEVPDSTWFTNRIGVRPLSPEEVGTGPAELDTPEAHKPWTIRSTKVGGITVGFVVEDARGIRYLLKFDMQGVPELETGAHVIVNRLLWACGYNVPDDRVVYLRRDELVLAPDATTIDEIGNKHRLTEREVERRLKSIHVESDGRIRALASRIVIGENIGGHPRRGVREDDPNDRIPHEQRRDLRGMLALFAWLEHGDLNQGNFLDVWMADPADRRRHYVMHYLIDFGKALGAMATIQHDLRRGHAYWFDLADMTQSLLTFGAAPRPWINRPIPAIRGVGVFEATTYDPATWKPDSPVYTPWRTSDRFDRFWASKLLVRFTRAQVRAAVEAARLTDPNAVTYLTETLLTRARMTARYWFNQVNPLDRFEVAASTRQLCFDDLMLTSRLESSAAATQYVIGTYDRSGRPTAARTTVRARLLGRTCSPSLPLAADGYTIVRIETQRPGFAGSTYVHLAPDPATHAANVIGIWRE